MGVPRNRYNADAHGRAAAIYTRLAIYDTDPLCELAKQHIAESSILNNSVAFWTHMEYFGLLLPADDEKPAADQDVS